MAKPNRVVHFEIHASDPDRAAKFYKKVFDWDISKATGLGWEYWMVMTARMDSKEPGINGGMVKREGGEPEKEGSKNAYVCSMVVEDYDETEKKIIDAGGKLVMPKFEIAGMAWQGYYLDTEGNTFGVHQPLVKKR